MVPGLTLDPRLCETPYQEKLVACNILARNLGFDDQKLCGITT